MNDDKETSSLPLTYPYDFLDPRRGVLPTKKENAALFWCYRKNRLTAGRTETTLPDEKRMYEEMKEIRDDLISYTNKCVDGEVLARAKEFELRMEDDNQKPCNINDVKKAMGSLEASDSNFNLVFRILFSWSRSKLWTANVVDAWMRDRNMIFVEQDSNDDRLRKHGSCYRGGFGTCSTAIKSWRINNYMRCVSKKNGWSISVANKEIDNTATLKKTYMENEKLTMYYVTIFDEESNKKKVSDINISNYV